MLAFVAISSKSVGSFGRLSYSVPKESDPPKPLAPAASDLSPEPFVTTCSSTVTSSIMMRCAIPPSIGNGLMVIRSECRSPMTEALSIRSRLTPSLEDALFANHVSSRSTGRKSDSSARGRPLIHCRSIPVPFAKLSLQSRIRPSGPLKSTQLGTMSKRVLNWRDERLEARPLLFVILARSTTVSECPPNCFSVSANNRSNAAGAMVPPLRNSYRRSSILRNGFETLVCNVSITIAELITHKMRLTPRKILAMRIHEGRMLIGRETTTTWRPTSTELRLVIINRWSPN